MAVIELKEESRAHATTEIQASLDGPDPANPTASDFARLMAEEVESLRAIVAGMPTVGRRYPAPLGDRIAQVAAQMRKVGSKWQEVGKTLGMSPHTVKQICIDRDPTLADIVPAPATVAAEIRGGSLAVVTPTGHRIEGLDLETALALLERLAR